MRACCCLHCLEHFTTLQHFIVERNKGVCVIPGLLQLGLLIQGSYRVLVLDYTQLPYLEAYNALFVL